MAASIFATLLGTAIQAHAQQQAAENQAQDTINAIGHQSAYQKQITDAFNALVGNLSGKTPADSEKAARGSYLDALNSAMPGANDTDINAGGGYSADAAREALSQRGQAINLADMLAKVQAPTDMRRKEGYDINNTGENIGKLANFARGTAGVDNLVTGSVQVNPWQMLLGNALEQYGMSTAGKGGKTAQNSSDAQSAGG